MIEIQQKGLVMSEAKRLKVAEVNWFTQVEFLGIAKCDRTGEEVWFGSPSFRFPCFYAAEGIRLVQDEDLSCLLKNTIKGLEITVLSVTTGAEHGDLNTVLEWCWPMDWESACRDEREHDVDIAASVLEV